MEDIVNTAGDASLEEIADRVYEDFETVTDNGYEWDGGTLRPWDYESKDDVQTALEGHAPFTTTDEIVATFTDDSNRASVEFTYDVQNFRFEKALEQSAE